MFRVDVRPRDVEAGGEFEEDLFEVEDESPLRVP